MSLPITLESSSAKSTWDQTMEEDSQSHSKAGAHPNTSEKQARVPQDPHEVHGARSGLSQSTQRTHAKEGGRASILPQKLQEKLPEKVERAVPNALHDTGDTGGLHRNH